MVGLEEVNHLEVITMVLIDKSSVAETDPYSKS